MGSLVLGSYDNKLCLCDWRYRKMSKPVDTRIQSLLKTSYVEGESQVINLAIEQLNAYFKGTLKEFRIPLLFVGSNFQKQVWNSLLTVPYGKTKSYLELSEILGNRKAIRAVAAANGANAISIIVPCHRIIGSDGKLVGYAGGIDVKRNLLNLEKKHSGLGVQTRMIF